MECSQVNGQNMPEYGELVWFHSAEGSWHPAIWLAPPGSPSWRHVAVMMQGEMWTTCHYSCFYRGEEMPDESR
jgi:hypothetical protein